MANYAFIDSQNVHQAIRHQGWALDWKRFRVCLKDKYGIAKAFAFIGYVPGREYIYTTLQEAGFVVIFKPTLHVRSAHQTIIKGNVDAELVLHAMIEWVHFEQAVIVTGDGDFYCLINHLLEHEKLSRLLIPDQLRYSSLLRSFGSHIVFMNSLQQAIQKNPQQ